MLGIDHSECCLGQPEVRLFQISFWFIVFMLGEKIESESAEFVESESAE